MAKQNNVDWTYAPVVFEVQKNGVTIDIDVDINKAMGSFNEASPGRVRLMKLDRHTSVKTILRSK